MWVIKGSRSAPIGFPAYVKIRPMINGLATIYRGLALGADSYRKPLNPLVPDAKIKQSV
ncbi:hypothetical protein GCM10008023_42210 [Sphingomonas glacialis]|uniref:Uncharacterized protein n=1 Tax=Sphingomonas glacialis TaxID=658225 RepID=A0ABQ3LVP7_9SPHN|nr:hypothetical protein GCM10008023_42210 [Sphingomonas glacialis]